MECRNCEYYKANNCKRQCMLLPDGKTCADCVHVERCTTIFGAKPENTSCGFEPIRFKGFEIFEDGELSCVGVVFSVEDVR